VPQAAAQAAAEGLNSLRFGLQAQPPLELQQYMLHQSIPPLQSDGLNAFHQRAILQQQQLSQQAALAGRSVHQSQNIHGSPYDLAAERVMREKLLAAREKSAFNEARLQNLQQIRHLQQHGCLQQGLQGNSVTGQHHALNGMTAASLGQQYALNGMTAAAGGQYGFNGTTAGTWLGQHPLLPNNGSMTANSVLGGAHRFSLPPELRNSESLDLLRGESLSSEGLLNLKRRVEAAALGLPPTMLNNTESIASLPSELRQIAKRESLSPEELIDLRNKMEASAMAAGTIPPTTLQNTDSISSLPPELWAIMSSRESENTEEALNSAAAQLGGGGDAVNALGYAGVNGASRFSSMMNGTLPSSTTLAHLRLADMWHQQRKHLVRVLGLIQLWFMCSLLTLFRFICRLISQFLQNAQDLVL
jgi:hypothetical protein